MRVFYEKKEINNPALPESFFSLRDLNFILDHGVKTYYELSNAVKERNILSFFKKGAEPFKLAMVNKCNYDSGALYLPHQVIFYDVYPKDVNKTDVYALVLIGERVELRHKIGPFSSTMEAMKGHYKVEDKLIIDRISLSFKILLDKVTADKNSQDLEKEKALKLFSENTDFKTALSNFIELGYINEEFIDLKFFADEIITEHFLLETDINKLELNDFYQLIYYKISHTVTEDSYLKKRGVLCDLEFLDSGEDYINFMKRLGEITKGEIIFSNILLRVDKEGYETLDFSVNNILKSWKLEKPGSIASDFFSRFSSLPGELGTKGRYTYFDKESQQFVIDYATLEEQEHFIAQTGLARKWLE